MKTTIVFCSVIGLAILSSCKKSDIKGQTGTNANASIAYQLKAANNVSPSNRTEGNLITWTAGYANVVKFSFDGEGECEYHPEGDYDEEHHEDYEDSTGHHHKMFDDSISIQRIDLFAPSTFSDTLSVTACHYKSITFEMLLFPAGQDAAVEVKGTYDSIPVIFRIDQPVILNQFIDTALISSGNIYKAITSLDLSILTKYITANDLNAASKDSSGTIIISATSNSNLYYKMLYHFHEMEEHEFHD